MSHPDSTTAPHAAPAEEPSPLRWYHLVSYFFGGAILMNTVPHLVNGVSGQPF